MSAAEWTISIIAIVIAVVLAARWERDSRRRDAGSVGGKRDDPRSDHEFMSGQWVAMARREITAALSGRDLDVEPFTLSEEFTDPPPHLRQGSSNTIGFFVRVGHGEVHVGDGPAPEADCRVISDYADALAIARDPDAASADPGEAARRAAEGRLRIEGDPSRMPAALQELDIHRLLASHTS
jgi:hypothetical protein